MRPYLASSQSLVFGSEECFEAARPPAILARIFVVTDLDSYFGVEHLNQVLDAFLYGHYDVLDNRAKVSTGADRIELDLFVRDREMHIPAISRKVLEGRYTFNPFMEREIPKGDTKEMRTISIASIRDSVVQRALYEYLYPTVDVLLPESVYGYRKGRSAHDAVRLIATHYLSGRVFVFDADIRRFFDTVDHDLLMNAVRGLRLDERAVTLVRRFLKAGRIPSAQVEEHRTRVGKKQKYRPEARSIGVPQGGVLSGLLSNLYLSQLDQAVEEHHIGYVRYADDFLVCCSSGDECEQVHRLADRELGRLKVELHPEKTKMCVNAESGVDFLGFRISTRGIRIRGRNVAKFKARIQKVVQTQKVHSTPESTLRALVWRLSFKIRGPDESHIRAFVERGKTVLPCRRVWPCRRSWIGFFRIVDDESQIRSLDRWLRRQISAFMWEKHRCRVGLSTMQDYGLPSLVNSMWKARCAPPLVVDGDSDSDGQ